MPHELPKAYEPGAIETRWAEYWVKEKLFHVETPAGESPASTSAAPPVFTLLLPPPNVTGRLHMGHMLNQTQMDIIVRWHLIGHLQGNKARKTLPLVRVIHAVDSLSVCAQIDLRASQPVDCLLQVSLDGDPSRGGARAAELPALAAAVAARTHLRVRGIMAVARSATIMASPLRPMSSSTSIWLV